VEAIYAETNVPDQWNEYIQLNADKSAELKAAGGEAHITEKSDPREGPGCNKK
jgi:ferredoxin